MTNAIQQLDSQLNDVVKTGAMLDALEQFYDPKCTFTEGNAEPRVGRQAQHDHLSAFFATLTSFEGATLHRQGIDDTVSLTEWTFEMTGPDGPIVWNEILRREWRGGKVISERYYTAD